jgi:hypothetical protein
LVYPFAFFLLLLQQGLFLQRSVPPLQWHVLPPLVVNFNVCYCMLLYHFLYTMYITHYCILFSIPHFHL